MEEFFKVLSALLPISTALFAAYLGWQQLTTSKHKLKLDLFERRLKIYNEVQKLLMIVVREGYVSLEQLSAFKIAVSDAEFLFGDDIQKYIQELCGHVLKLHQWKSEYRDSSQVKPDGYDHKKVVDGKHVELDWLYSQIEGSKEGFAKYLDINV